MIASCRLITRFAALCLLAGLILLPAGALGAQAEKAPVWRIRSLKLKGFDNLSPRQARQVMATKGPGFFAVRRKPVFDPLKLAGDRKRLLQLYREHGFFSVTLDTKVIRHPRDHTVSIIITAHELDPVIVRRVELELDPAPGREYWRSLLRPLIVIQPGEAFNLEQYRKSKARLRAALDDQGHPLNKVEGQVRVYPGQLKAEVYFRVDIGPRVLFGPTRVEGTDYTSPRFVIRSKTYARGQPFSRRALRQTQAKLLDSGFYSSVSLEPVFEEMEQGQVPVKVLVQERKRHSLRLGLGYGTEDLIRMRIVQTNRNMFRFDETFTIEGKWSAIYLGMVGRIMVPYVFNLRSDLLLAGGVQQRDEEAYENRRIFFTPLFEFRLGRHWSWFAGYNLESDRMLELKALVPDPEAENQNHFISSLPLGLKYDDRDSLLNPTRGSYLRLHLEFSSEVLGSELSFFRPRLDMSHVMPLGKLWGKGQWRLAGRLQLGLCLPLEATDRIPLIRRFFPGGANSVRGYPYQSLGPLDSGGKPLGGEAALVGNLELRFPIRGNLRGVVFLDLGNAYEDWEEIDFFNLRYTAGLGLRYQTPVGPIRLDWGYQINPPEDAPIPRHELYFSVGQAF